MKYISTWVQIFKRSKIQRRRCAPSLIIVFQPVHILCTSAVRIVKSREIYQEWILKILQSNFIRISKRLFQWRILHSRIYLGTIHMQICKDHRRKSFAILYFIRINDKQTVICAEKQFSIYSHTSTILTINITQSIGRKEIIFKRMISRVKLRNTIFRSYP